MAINQEGCSMMWRKPSGNTGLDLRFDDDSRADLWIRVFSLGIQIAQCRKDLQALGSNVGTICILKSL